MSKKLMILNIFRKNLKPELANELIHILNENLKYVKASKNSIWSEIGVEKISNKLSKAINLLEQQKSLGQFGLKYLFAPAGPLQEIAMANNWIDQYMELSERFDRAIENWS